MTDKMERLRDVSRLLYLLCILMTIVLIVLALLSFIAAVFPDLSVFDDIRRYEGGSTPMAIGSFFGGVDVCLMALLLGTVAAMFKDISESHTPFLQQNPKRIMLLGHVVMFMAVALPIAKYVVSSVTLVEFHLDISRIVMMLIIAIIAYAVALIFDYGAQLQKESDETL